MVTTTDEIEIDTPDADVEEKLRDAVDELRPDTESPMQELFALDGLGNIPNERRSLPSKSIS